MAEKPGDDGLKIVDLRFESLRDLQEDFGPFLAPEGFFLKGEFDLSPSDVLRFRLMLPGDFVLVEGAGVVIWVRSPAEASEKRPPGVAVGFATLSDQGRELVERIIASHMESGGRPFDMSRPSEEEAAEEAVEVAETQAKNNLRFTVRDQAPQAAPESVGLSAPEEPAVSPATAPVEAEPGAEDLALPFELDEPEAQPEPEAPAPESPPAKIEPKIENETEPEPEIPTTDFGPFDEESALDTPADAPPESIPAPVVEREPAAKPDTPPVSPPETASGIPVGTSGEDDRAISPNRRVMDSVEVGGKGYPESPENRDFGLEFSPMSDVDDGAEDDGTSDFGGDAFEVDLPGEGSSNLPDVESYSSSGRRKGGGSGRGGLWVAVIVVLAILAGGGWFVWTRYPAMIPWIGSGAAGADNASGSQASDETSEEAYGTMTDQDLEAAVEAAVEAVASPEVTPAQETRADETVPAPVPTAAVKDEPAASENPATAVVDIAAQPGSGETAVLIRGNGAIDDGRVKASVLPSPPRVLVRLSGIEQGYRPLEISVGSPEISVIRVGHHAETRPPSLWVVLDRTGEGVTLKSVDTSGNLVRIVVGP